MQAVSKIKSFVVEGTDRKDAYLKGCKRYAQYIASSQFQNISLKVEHVEGNPKALRFILLTTIDMREEQEAFCKICKELHCSFYINEEYNCSRCNLKSFLRKLQHRTNISKGYYKSKIDE